MLANTPDSPPLGSLSKDVQKPATFRQELLEFIAAELPRWRDRPDRPVENSETILTSQLCAHLNGVARHALGWDILQFRNESPDELQRGRKIDLIPSPSGVAIWVEGRRHTEFDSLMPIECKRLPTPKGRGRDEREYVINRSGTTGGIQRFKCGLHGGAHRLGAMIAYVQDGNVASWEPKVAGWISDLINAGESEWTINDLLRLERMDATKKLSVLSSSHTRQKGLQTIELRHFWMEMN